MLVKMLNLNLHHEFCRACIDQVHEECEMKAKFGYTPPSLNHTDDLGGVHEDVYTPFFNLHNPLTVHSLLELGNIVTAGEYIDAHSSAIGSTFNFFNGYTPY